VIAHNTLCDATLQAKEFSPWLASQEPIREFFVGARHPQGYSGDILRLERFELATLFNQKELPLHNERI